MNDTFEDRLWNALRHEAQSPDHELPTDRLRARPARRSATVRRVGFGLIAAASVGVTLAIVPGGGSTPAYAVEMQKGGAVKVTVHDALKATRDPAQVEALESNLRAAGIKVIVDSSTPYLCHSRSGHKNQFTIRPRRPGVKEGIVSYMDSSVVSRPLRSNPIRRVIILHRGDTAWIESGSSLSGDRLYNVALLGASCAPALAR